VCHAYQVLVRGGFNPARVVVMMYDDIAHNPANPHRGKLFNCPACPDVYHGVPKDYTGGDVTAFNFFSVLVGDKLAMRSVGSGRVIESCANDRVFLYYSDHGARAVCSATLQLCYPNLDCKRRMCWSKASLSLALCRCTHGCTWVHMPVCGVALTTCALCRRSWPSRHA
jgi:Peptidase C13 family